MITIKVGEKPLYLPKDTVLVLEQSNNIFDDQGYTDDIVWTFDLPAEPNQVILGAVQFTYTGGKKRYECELSVGGITLSRGILYVQKATDERYISCGIVTNSFGVGFGERLMKDNEYGADIVISDTEDNHITGWISFLQASLANESRYKFFLFADESFYSDNEDYGYHQNIISGLLGTVNDEQFCKYVNRLFFDSNKNIIQNPDKNGNAKIRQGVRVFNSADPDKCNGYCFAPAIRLDWLVGKVVENAGLLATGSFFSDEQIHRLFSQSLNAMDGDVFQYGLKTWLHVGGSINIYEQTISKGQAFHIDTDSGNHTSFGWINNVSFSFRLLLPVEELVYNDTTSGNYNLDQYAGKRLDEIYALAISTASGTLPTIRIRASEAFNEADGTKSFFYGRFPTYNELKDRVEDASGRTVDSINSFEGFVNAGCTVNYGWSVGPIGFNGSERVTFFKPTECILVQLTKSVSKPVFFSGSLGGYTEGTVLPAQITTGWSSTTPLFIRLVKVRVLTANEDIAIRLPGYFSRHTAHLNQYGDLEYLDNYEIMDSLQIDTTDVPLNIFSNILRWRDHVPKLSNGEFLLKICKLFGLNLFADNITKKLQLSFFSDVMQAQSFDITEWVSVEERWEYEPKEYRVHITPSLSVKPVSSNNIIPSQLIADTLPPAVVSKNKHAYIRAEKAYRRSTKIKDSSKFRWEQAGGDDRKLIAGAKYPEECEDVSIDAQVPNMRMVDEEIDKTKRKYICELNIGGNSPLLDENYTGEFDFVLQQYHGHRLLNMPGGVTTTQAYIEDANPTRFTDGEVGNEDSEYLDLSADGAGSIGQKWLKPLYGFLGNCEKYRFVAYLPIWAFLKVYNLLKPQNGSPAQQTRWLYIRGKKYIPIRMSYEFGVNQTVVTTIECAAPHIEL